MARWWFIFYRHFTCYWFSIKSIQLYICVDINIDSNIWPMLMFMMMTMMMMHRRRDWSPSIVGPVTSQNWPCIPPDIHYHWGRMEKELLFVVHGGRTRESHSNRFAINIIIESTAHDNLICFAQIKVLFSCPFQAFNSVPICTYKLSLSRSHDVWIITYDYYVLSGMERDLIAKYHSRTTKPKAESYSVWLGNRRPGLQGIHTGIPYAEFSVYGKISIFHSIYISVWT